MKRLIFAASLSLVLAHSAFAQPLTGYTNFGSVNLSGIVIDATNVVNLGIIGISVGGIEPYGFSDVLTYTNRNVMTCNEGFLFNDSPAAFGNIGPSVNFVNQNPGQIYGVGGTAPQIIITATNITNSGILQVGQTGVIAASGNSLDLGHGTALVEGFDQNASGGAVLGPGEFIQYWGSDNNSNSFILPNLSVPGALTAPSTITNNDYTVTSNFNFLVPNALAVAFTNVLSPSNITTQVIIYGDSVGLVQESAYFMPITSFVATNKFQTAVVEWSAQVTNVAGQAVSNTLFLTDDLASLPSNVTEVVNNTSLSGLAQLVPTNYTLLRTSRGTNVVNGNATYAPALFNNGFGTNGNGVGLVTNLYSTFAVDVEPVTAQPDSLVAGSTVSNVTGRVIVSAGQSLDLTEAVINAGNYLNLYSPNDFRGSQQAQITFPFGDINLGSSNGQMVISNLVVPYLPRFTGSIQAWTAAWTNLTSGTAIVAGTNGMNTTNTFTVTNAFMVTMVASSLEPIAPVSIENLALRSTNMVISDILSVNSSMVLNAQNLTITSNAPGDATPNGAVVFDPADQSYLYSANFPAMLNFTNSGQVESFNAAYFQVRQNPYSPTAGDGPWQSIVNQGSILSDEGGLAFWANVFTNSGFIVAGDSGGFGPVFIQSSTAVITNGTVAASTGDMSIISGNLTIANEGLQATGYLNLGATNLLTDLVPSGTGSVPSGNSFSSGDGFSLLTAPTSPSGLLGTSVTSACFPSTVCQNTWAGTPVALPPPGFLPTMANNAPIGQLILDGGNNNSVFHFQGLDSVNPYAMYVDQIILQDGATNTNSSGKYTAFNIDPNVTIYFLNATAGTNNIAPVLNTNVVAGGGHLTWLSNYMGHFSVINITYPDGASFPMNSSYVQAYGLPPEPPLPLTAQNIKLTIGVTNVNSTPMASISWYSQANATNRLYYRTLTNPSWQVRTNFVQGATNGRVKCLDSLATGRMYKVNVSQ